MFGGVNVLFVVLESELFSSRNVPSRNVSRFELRILELKVS